MMDLTITGQHLTLPPDLRAYMITRLERTAGHCKEINSARFILSLDGATHKAQAALHSRAGGVVGHAEDQDRYAAVDRLLEKPNRQ